MSEEPVHFLTHEAARLAACGEYAGVFQQPELLTSRVADVTCERCIAVLVSERMAPAPIDWLEFTKAMFVEMMRLAPKSAWIGRTTE